MASCATLFSANSHLLLCPGGGFVGTCSVSPAWGRWWASLVARGVVKKKVFTNVLAWLRGHCGTALALLTAPASVWLQVTSAVDVQHAWPLQHWETTPTGSLCSPLRQHGPRSRALSQL